MQPSKNEYVAVKDSVRKIIKHAGNRISFDKKTRPKQIAYNTALSKYRNLADLTPDSPLLKGALAAITRHGNCQEFAELGLIMLLADERCRAMDYFICQVPTEKMKIIDSGVVKDVQDYHVFIVADIHSANESLLPEGLMHGGELGNEQPDQRYIIDCWSNDVYPVSALEGPENKLEKKQPTKKQDGTINARYYIQNAPIWSVQLQWDGKHLNRNEIHYDGGQVEIIGGAQGRTVTTREIAENDINKIKDLAKTAIKSADEQDQPPKKITQYQRAAHKAPIPEKKPPKVKTDEKTLKKKMLKWEYDAIKKNIEKAAQQVEGVIQPAGQLIDDKKDVTTQLK